MGKDFYTLRLVGKGIIEIDGHAMGWINALPIPVAIHIRNWHPYHLPYWHRPSGLRLHFLLKQSVIKHGLPDGYASLPACREASVYCLEHFNLKVTTMIYLVSHKIERG